MYASQEDDECSIGGGTKKISHILMPGGLTHNQNCTGQMMLAESLYQKRTITAIYWRTDEYS